jgi:predicted dehydrogenase
MSIKLGILGFAHGHVNIYCNRWQEQPDLGVQVVAGWDHDQSRAEAAGTQFGIETMPSVDALLNRPDIDAVVITSETSLHADLVEQAARAHKAIVLQKPLALTLEQADRIVQAVEKSGVPFTLAWQMRVDSHNMQIKSLLDEGHFGRVYMLRRRHCLNTQMWPDFDKTWHVNPELNRDIFADDAAHPIDFVYWLLGKPNSVMAEMGTLHNPAIPNDTGSVIFRYADGAFAEVSCCFVATATENVTEVICERGSIIENYGDIPSTNITWPPGGIQLKWYLAEEGQWIESDLPNITQHVERIAGLAAPLAEFLQGKRAPIATAAEGREVLRMVLACYESAQEGKRVVLD